MTTDALRPTVVILCGGSATRMGHVCGQVSKAMLPVCGKPFLVWLTGCLALNGYRPLIVSGHHTADINSEFSRPTYEALGVRTLIQPKILGTGGAIRLAADFLIAEESFVVVNGDTIVSNVNLNAAVVEHLERGSIITQVLSVNSNQNIGNIIIDDEQVLFSLEADQNTEFILSESSKRLSSTGIFVFNANFVRSEFPLAFSSLETDLMSAFIRRKLVRHHVIETSVYDFGTPERFENLKTTALDMQNMFV